MHFRVAEYFDQRTKRKMLFIPVEEKYTYAEIRHFLLIKKNKNSFTHLFPKNINTSHPAFHAIAVNKFLLPFGHEYTVSHQLLLECDQKSMKVETALNVCQEIIISAQQPMALLRCLLHSALRWSLRSRNQMAFLSEIFAFSLTFTPHFPHGMSLNNAFPCRRVF